MKFTSNTTEAERCKKAGPGCRNTGGCVLWFLPIILLVAAPWERAAGQESGYMISPAAAHGDDAGIAFGLRWGVDYFPEPSVRPRLRYPSELWYSLNMNGALLTRAEANVEPLVRASFDFGWRVSLSAQRAFDIEHPDRDLQEFDLGYLFAGLQGMGETDQQFDEGIAGMAAVLHYRALGRYRGIWLLVPDIRAGYAVNVPVMSERYDAADAGRDPYRQLDLGALWTFRSVYASTPEWFNNLRLAAGLNHYRRFGLGEAAAGVTGSSGTYYHLQLGYELSGVSRYLNHVFVRYSGGEYPVIYEERQQWMVGVVIRD